MAKENTNKQEIPAQQETAIAMPLAITVTNQTCNQKIDIQSLEDDGQIQILQLQPGESAQIKDNEHNRNALTWFEQRSMISVNFLNNK